MVLRYSSEERTRYGPREGPRQSTCRGMYRQTSSRKSRGHSQRGEARCSGNHDRANVTMVDDTNIVANEIDAEWERGTRWACFAMALVWGPIIALRIMGVF